MNKIIYKAALFISSKIEQETLMKIMLLSVIVTFFLKIVIDKSIYFDIAISLNLMLLTGYELLYRLHVNSETED